MLGGQAGGGIEASRPCGSLDEPPHSWQGSNYQPAGISEVWDINEDSFIDADDEDGEARVNEVAAFGSTPEAGGATKSLLVRTYKSSLGAQLESEIKRANGAVYTGQVRKGIAMGRGIQRWKSGATYDGDWVDDMMQGSGYLKMPDGARYEGRWLESKQHGEGVFTAVDGGQYSGQWNNGKMHGLGRYEWPDGSIFTGDFVDGERTGHGHLKYSHGCAYEGGWKCSKQHGKGVFTTRGGRTRTGLWEEGTRVRWCNDGAKRCSFEIAGPDQKRNRPMGACPRCVEKIREICPQM